MLDVRDLAVEFRTRQGVVRAVDGLSFTLDRAQTLAILGESGSGKSATALAIMGLLPKPAGHTVGGEVRFQGKDLVRASPRELRRVRGDQIAMIFQDPLSSLNPVFPVGFQIGEMLRRRKGLSRSEAKKAAIELMDRVHIPAAKQRVMSYPFQFSGGMRQRVMIAIALAMEPQLVIADEPTTALDVTVQAQIMELLRDLCQAEGMALILITHDLGVASEVADRVAVMYAGRIVETGDVREVYDQPRHPYTLGLIESVPHAGTKGKRLVSISGQPPSLLAPPSGCSFHPRCAFARDRCSIDDPPLRDMGPTRRSACHYAEEVAR